MNPAKNSKLPPTDIKRKSLELSNQEKKDDYNNVVIRMGCGSSYVSSYPTVSNLDHAIETPEKKLIESAPSSQSVNPIPIVEEATRKEPSFEQGAFNLPEGDFVNGQLGITEESEIESIKKKIGYGKFFIDNDFPPDNSSLFFNGESDPDISWKRPHELVKIPKLFVSGVDRKDVVQGILGNCWFLSSCASVAREQKLIERVIPPKQPLCGGGYKGLIWCRFWRFGQWVSVCIDDYLPVKNGELIYSKCADPSEFWVALLEKAYAKIHGSYQALEGGQSMDALVDLTGGLAERFDITDDLDKSKVYGFLGVSLRNGAFVTTSRKGDWRQAHKSDITGLVEGHAYSVTRIGHAVADDNSKIRLIRIRNPWGNSAEWKGDWSDEDQMWNTISEDQKHRLMKGTKKDGEFWMTFNDFWKEFEEISLCVIGPDFDNDGKVDIPGQVKAIRGAWIENISAGGSRNDINSFATNPQFLLTVFPSNESDVINELDSESDMDLGDLTPDKAHVLIGLLQEHRQSDKNRGVKMHQIGFCVYWNSNPEERLEASHFLRVPADGTSGPYINYREVIMRLELNAGSYVIIPATFDPGINAEFMVRVYSSSEFEIKRLN